MSRFKFSLVCIPLGIAVVVTVFFLITVIFPSQDKGRSNAVKESMDCKFNDNAIDPGCFSRFIEHTVKTKGVGAAMDELASALRSDKNFSGSCHALAHEIGQQAYQMFSKQKEIDVSPKITYCTYGFYHGFMEAAAQIEGNYKTISHFCAYIDSKLRETGLDSSAECFHGIGHGAVTGHEDDIRKKGIEAVVQSSLRLCEEATQVPSQRVNCSSGVFNGVANSYLAGEYGLVMDKKNPAAICKKNPIYAQTCYGFMARVYLALASGDLIEAVDLAKKTAEPDFMNSLTSNAAVIFAGRYLKSDLDPVLSSCRSLPEDLRESCIKGAVTGLVQASAPEEEFENGHRLCAFQGLSQEARKICVRELFMELKKSYSRQQLQAICEASDLSERAVCIPLVRE